MTFRYFLLLWLRLLAAVFFAVPMHAVHANEDFLDPEVAFKVFAQASDDHTVKVTYTIAPGYYLYGEQFKFVAKGVSLGTVTLPAGKTKFDDTFQKTVETYRDTVHIAIPVESASGAFRLLATNQGCADKGLCYPPQQRAIDVKLTGFGGDGSVTVVAASGKVISAPGSVALATPLATAPAVVSVAPPTAPTYSADDIGIDTALRSGKFWTVICAFFFGGILLSLTPCVLPMLPILSSIIVGQGVQVSRGRGLALAASYSLGMAMVYTALGVAAGLAGEGISAALQKPWVLATFAAALIALSLSMFGFYELQLSLALTGRLSNASRRLPAGRLAGVFAMGGVSALIVSPCVAAPLAGALVYLSQTHNVWLGGTALFSLAAGMSVPLLMLGASAGALLPRTGAWMDEVKRFFGVILLGVALWTIHSVLPVPSVLALWGALAIGAAVMFASGQQDGRTGWTQSLWRRALAGLLAACGVLQLAGAASGGADPLQPLAQFRLQSSNDMATMRGPVFASVRNVAELDNVLRTAGRPVVVDFYADWCVSCKEMEKFTFTDPIVQKRMSRALLLKVDVTANNDEDRALLKRFQIFGPPSTIFFDPQGREVSAARIAGFQNSSRFLLTLQTAGL